MRWLRTYAAPILWVLIGVILFWAWGGLLPRVRWNAIELMMGRNLLRGYGLVVAPLDPPALWRPLFGVLLCAFVELFTTDPYVIYQTVYTLSLTVFLISAFYAARTLWGATAGHVACLFILTSGALTARLVGHVHSISHVAFLMTAGPALLATALALRWATRTRLFVAGACWGLVWLARWETLPFFGITLAVLLYAAYAASKNPRALATCSFVVLGFAALFVPATIYQSWVKVHYGITGPSAITTFYAAEAWITGTGDEDAGFAAAVRKYGSLEANHSSVLVAIAHNPEAFWSRFRFNVRNFLHLFTGKDFFDPLWLLLLAGLLCDPGWTRKHWLPLAWLFLLFLSSASVCLFQIDTRYLTISLPSILLLLSAGAACFVQWARRRWIRGGLPAAVACLTLICLRPAVTSYHQWIAARENPFLAGRGRQIDFVREQAREFRQTVHPTRPVTLMVYPPAGMPSDPFLLSYFAETGICWKQPGLYQRDKIFSWFPKELEYVYVPEESLYSTDLLLKLRPIARFEQQGFVYYLIQPPVRPYHPGDDSERDRVDIGFVPPGRPFAEQDTARRESLRLLLARDYPRLIPGFVEKRAEAGLKASLEFVPNTPHADKVGCGVLAAAPDGRPDRLFKLIFKVKPSSMPLVSDMQIGYIELQRREPLGIFRASNQDYILGVASADNGPLLNAADGTLNIPVREKDDLWLYACDDGGNKAGTTYWARMRIGKNIWVSSDPVNLP